ncbi:uncharacterized protein Z520_00135 [Fonsecaea multimorphosa CBS 102226]|uniref:AAA+ ATPase domain-containing protein n=1 Tax=Fonsecaea multimorphosa CBS 102226 TaxID=1442371 RepID=A0A0D2L342_9EURO|nr:uncharacterized protein Z520_00135 [Fonsecaea multimorphosa CBS 102226]KIY03444.1 hypothetical protein Z520_00135 [Fonsecaea multimorphosa CBS 102226]
MLVGGFGVLLFVRLLRQLCGQFLWNVLLYCTTMVVHLDSGDELYLALWWLYHKKKLRMRTNEYYYGSITDMINASPENQLHLGLASRGRNGKLVLVPDPTNMALHYRGRSFFLRPVSEGDACTIRCLGWSIKPIEDLLDDAYEGYKADIARCSISLYTPSTDPGKWNSCTPVSARSLESVETGFQVKTALLADIDRYLNGKDWYRRRSIPWRRGYLFHGPPGTGKSSLVTALAAHFQLRVYAITFSDGLTDGVLHQLLRRISQVKCIVLFEDIDSAGLTREGQDVDRGEVPDQTEPNEKSEELSDPPRPLKSRKRCAVTLSGVLNAIDGIGAPEGHILILTSNYAERLDPALTRPGRVDYRLEFELATKEQAHNIFLRLQASNSHGEARVGLEELAQAFADKIPEKVLSPAEIQDFLLHRPDDPERAVREAGDWVKGVLAAKGKQQEIVDGDPDGRRGNSSRQRHEGLWANILASISK